MAESEALGWAARGAEGLLEAVSFYRAMHFSANARSWDRMCPSVRPSVRSSVCNVGDLWSHRLEISETNCTDNWRVRCKYPISSIFMKQKNALKDFTQKMWDNSVVCTWTQMVTKETLKGIHNATMLCTRFLGRNLYMQIICKCYSCTVFALINVCATVKYRSAKTR